MKQPDFRRSLLLRESKKAHAHVHGHITQSTNVSVEAYNSASVTCRAHTVAERLVSVIWHGTFLRSLRIPELLSCASNMKDTRTFSWPKLIRGAGKSYSTPTWSAWYMQIHCLDPCHAKNVTPVMTSVLSTPTQSTRPDLFSNDDVLLCFVNSMQNTCCSDFKDLKT